MCIGQVWLEHYMHENRDYDGGVIEHGLRLLIIRSRFKSYGCIPVHFLFSCSMLSALLQVS